MTRPIKPKIPDSTTETALSGKTASDPAVDGSVTDRVETGDDTSSDSGSLPNGDAASNMAKEFGGQKGPEPTRYGDWEKNGRCTDF